MIFEIYVVPSQLSAAKPSWSATRMTRAACNGPYVPLQRANRSVLTMSLPVDAKFKDLATLDLQESASGHDPNCDGNREHIRVAPSSAQRWPAHSRGGAPRPGARCICLYHLCAVAAL